MAASASVALGPTKSPAPTSSSHRILQFIPRARPKR